MRRLTAALMAGIMVLTTLTGSLTAFADTEIDETAPVIHSIELLNGDDYDGTDEPFRDPLKVKINLTEEGSGVSWIDLDFGAKAFSFRYDAHHFVEEEGHKENELLFSGEHVIECRNHDALPMGRHELVGISVGDANNNVSYVRKDEIASYLGNVPTLNVTKTNYKVENIELTSFRFLQTDGLDTEGELPVELSFQSSFEVSSIMLDFYDLDTEREEPRELQVSFKEGERLKSGTHKVAFPFNELYTKGTKLLYGICFNGKYWIDVTESSIVENPKIHITKGKAPRRDPEIIDFAFAKNEIKAPDVIRVDLQIKDYGNKLNQAGLLYVDKNGKSYSLEGPLKKKSDGSYYSEIPVHPFITEGELKLDRISVENYIPSQDACSCFGMITDTERLAKGDITLTSGYDITYFGSVGNKKVPSVLKEMNAGETAVLDCRNYKIASKAIFEAIAGRDVTVAFVDNNVQWVFNGKDIQKSKCKKINLTSYVQVVSGGTAGFPDDKKVAKLVFRDNGELPGEVEMRINYDYLAAKYNFDKKNLKLTYLAPTNPVLEDADVDTAKDNFYEYEVDHNSTFVLSKTKAKLGTTTVTMVPNNLKSVKIKWKKTKGNGYYVYRATKKDGKYKKVATIKGNKNVSYVDKDVVKGKNYYYKVKPYSTKKSFNKTARMSKPCKVYTKLKTPRFCSAKYSKYKKGVAVEWWSNADAEKYVLYRATKAEGPYKKIKTLTLSFTTDKTAKKDKTYYYKVKSIYKDGSRMNSNFSNVKSTQD
ncbi:MAG: hypothetical protein IKJ77_05100 [Firmicutes bacterium]|nr:hypothetical protein [Bacillota bacterium]